jgi:hypothetical protein
VQSLKASTQGLARLRQARQQITQEKGWAVDHPKWLEQASGFLPPVKNGKGMVPATVGISTWKRFLAGEPIKPTNFKAFCQVLELNWEEVVDADTVIRPPGGNAQEEVSITQHSPREEAGDNSIPNPQSPIPNRADWGEAMDVSVFYGRTEELATLKQWIVQDNCRLVGLLGMGGIGKTALSVKFAQHVQHEFNCVIWRSLQNAPPVNDILATLIQILSNQQETPANLPESTSDRITQLIEYLRSSHCLLILDNADSILQAGAVAGQYRPGYEGYGEFIKRVGETSHRSCLILTSCEKPQELAALEGETLPVRSLELTGLHEEEAWAIFQAKGTFTGTPEEWKALIQHYAGNPLALNMVASAIRDAFGSSISEFVKDLKAGTWPFADISQLLERQFNRLTSSELEVIYWLAINREPILKQDIICPTLTRQLPDTLKSLRRKFLVEKRIADRLKPAPTQTNSAAGALVRTDSIQPAFAGFVCIAPDFQSVGNLPNQAISLFTLQPVFMEWVTNQLIAKVCEEIETGEIALFNSHPLPKIQAEVSLIDTEIRFILKPIMDRLLNRLKGKSNVENQLNKLLSQWQTKYPYTPGYTASNVRNLLGQLNAVEV